MTERDGAVVALLAGRGAGSIDHPGGNLLDHLVRTGELLRSWGGGDAIVRAGLAHAAYGTDGFAVALFDLAERGTVVEAVGEGAEAIVYRYASCDRRVTYPRIGRSAAVAFRNRFTGADETVGPGELQSFAELTMANELDVLRHSETIRRDHGPAIRTLFSSWQEVVGPAAFDAFLAVADDLA